VLQSYNDRTWPNHGDGDSGALFGRGRRAAFDVSLVRATGNEASVLEPHSAERSRPAEGAMTCACRKKPWSKKSPPFNFSRNFVDGNNFLVETKWMMGGLLNGLSPAHGSRGTK